MNPGNRNPGLPGKQPAAAGVLGSSNNNVSTGPSNRLPDDFFGILADLFLRAATELREEQNRQAVDTVEGQGNQPPAPAPPVVQSQSPSSPADDEQERLDMFLRAIEVTQLEEQRKRQAVEDQENQPPVGQRVQPQPSSPRQPEREP